MTLRYGELFAGYGGLDLGLQAVLGGSTAWHVEFDKHPSAILAHHWPDVPNYGDITKVDFTAVEPVDVLTGGFPCQDVSHAGRRAGLIRDGEGRTRSGLWGEMLRAITELRPRLVVAENVRGLLSAAADSDVEPCPWCLGDANGEPDMRALGAVLADLADVGYDAWWVGLRAADVGAAHGRFRVFIFATPADSEGHEQRKPAIAGPLRDEPRASVGGHAADGLTLLPTPVTNDMGEGKTVDHWDAWTATMQAKHGNGNGHGKSLAIEAQRLAGESGGEFVGDCIAGNVLPLVDLDQGADVGECFGAERDGFHDSNVPALSQAHLASSTSRSGNRLLPTPTASDSNGAGDHGTGGPDLRTALLLPTHRATDGTKGGPNQRGSSGDLMLPSAVQLLPTPIVSDWNTSVMPYRDDHDRVQLRDLPHMQWGDYAPAIARWETVIGRPAPAPTEPGPKGNPRLSAHFVEWMMGLPLGWVTDVDIPRNAQLKALGNGVVPAQAAAATQWWLAQVAAETRRTA